MITTAAIVRMAWGGMQYLRELALLTSSYRGVS